MSSGGAGVLLLVMGRNVRDLMRAAIDPTAPLVCCVTLRHECWRWSP